MDNQITFFVPGIPRPQGSKRAWVNPKTQKAIMVESSKDALKDWRAKASFAAREVMKDRPMFTGPVRCTVLFYFPRPKRHYRGNNPEGEMRIDAPNNHAGTPDIEKLLRAVSDALAGIVFLDDKQVSEVHSSKSYIPQPRINVYVPGAEIMLEVMKP